MREQMLAFVLLLLVTVAPSLASSQVGNKTVSNPIIEKWEADVRNQVELSKKTP